MVLRRDAVEERRRGVGEGGKDVLLGCVYGDAVE